MIRKALGTIIGVIFALALVGFVPGARASERNQSTKFTFSQPVQLPGKVVLPSGTYWFEVPDVVSARQIVQVFDSDHKLLGTFTTINTERSLKKAEDIQLAVGRTPNELPMLMNWVYPGWIVGHEFVYSRQQKSRLSETGSVVTVQVPTGRRVEIGR